MTKPKPKAPARRKVAPKPAPARQPKRTQAERKDKAIDLMLQAIAGGWSLRRFSRRSGVSIRSLLRWVQEPAVHPRYIQAMQTKAMLLPDEAMEIVGVLRQGGEVQLRPDPDKPKELRFEFVPANTKALGVALRHLEFRMMREIKVLYQPSSVVTNVTDPSQVPDDKLDERINTLVGKYLGADPGARDPSPSAENEKAGG